MYRRTSLIAVFAATTFLIAGPAEAAPKKKDKKAATVVAKAETAPASKKAQAADAAQTGKQAQAAEPAPLLPTKKVDPLEAALAKAAAAAEAKPAPAPKAGKTSKKVDAFAGLRAQTRSAAGLELLDDSRNNAVPSGEVVEHMQAKTLDQRQVATVIQKNLRQLRYCHESLTARGHDVDGHASLTFVVEPKGNVSKVVVHASGVDGKRLERCLGKRVKRWKFPLADAPTDVSYPLLFEAKKAPPAAE